MSEIAPPPPLEWTELRRICTFFIVASLLWGCESAPPDGRIRVKNDSQDSAFNVVQVVGGGAYAALKPGESILLPQGTTRITLSRAYKDYARSYRVECPPLKQSDPGILVKMIDAHLNRLKGGCRTVYAEKR